MIKDESNFGKSKIIKLKIPKKVNWDKRPEIFPEPITQKIIGYDAESGDDILLIKICVKLPKGKRCSKTGIHDIFGFVGIVEDYFRNYIK